MRHRSAGHARTRPARRGSRTLGSLALAAIVVAGLAACSSDSDSSDPSSGSTPASAASGGTTAGSADATGGSTGSGGDFSGVTVSHWQHHSDARAAIVEDFISSYKDANGSTIDFESIPYSDYFTRLGAALEAGTGPCVFQLPANILNEFQTRGELAPVPDSVMTAAEIEETFIPASINLLKIDDAYYGLPTDVQTMMLFYNDDLFEAAGLDPTKDFETWDEFEAAAIALTKADGDTLSQAGLDITGSPYQWYYSAPTLAYEDGLVADDTLQVQYASDPGYQVWERLTGLVTKDHVDSPEFLAEQSKFGVGLAGMTLKEYTFNGVYKLTAPDVKFSVHMPPPVADEQFAPVASTSWSYVVGSDCADQDAAWAWVSYLTSEDAQRTWIASGGELPSRKALLADTSLTTDPAVAAGFAALAEAVPYDSAGWDDVFAIQQQIWDEIVVGDGDVKAAVDTGAAAEQDLYATKGITK